MILPSSQAIYSLTKLVEPTALTKFLSIFANLLGKFNLVICVILFPLTHVGECLPIFKKQLNPGVPKYKEFLYFFV